MCHFVFTISEKSKDDFDRLKKKIEENNGSVEGDDHSGSFEIKKAGLKVSGTYQIENEKFIVDISHKPAILSCGKIKELIEEGLKE